MLGILLGCIYAFALYSSGFICPLLKVFTGLVH